MKNPLNFMKFKGFHRLCTPAGTGGSSQKCARHSSIMSREPGDAKYPHRIGVERDGLDAFIHQPLGEIRMVGRSLTADADVLA